MSVGLILVGVVVFSGIGEAFTFTFSSETITTGYTVDFSNSQVEDASYEDLYQEDVASDNNQTASEQWILNATDSGTFPTDIQTDNEVYIAYQENNTAGGGSLGELELNPTGDGHELDYTPKGGGDHYVEVDDASGSPDDASTEVNKNAGNQEDYWILENNPGGLGTILNVRLNLRIKHNVGGEEFAFCLYDSVNGEWCSSDVADSTSWVTYYLDLDSTNPLTASAWTWSDIDATELGIKSRAIGGFTGIQYCTMGYVNVTYDIPGATDYNLDFWQNVTSITSGEGYQLEVNGKIVDENLLVYVFDNTLSTWDLTGTIDSATDEWIIFTLDSTDHVVSGKVMLWFRDATPDDNTQSIMSLDYVGVKTFQYEYALEVRHDASGVYGQDPELQVKGYRGGSENFDVDVWNWTTSGWNDARLDSGFTGINAWQQVHLVSDEYTDGNVRVRYVDDTPTGTTNSTLYLDCVQVVSDNTPVTIDDKIVEEYWTVDVAMSHQWNSTDPDLEANTWTLGGNPGFLVLDQGYRTAFLNGTCTEAGKSYPIYLNVSDAGSSDQEIFTLYCANTPVVIADPIVEEYWLYNVSFAHQWNSTDPDLQPNDWTLGGSPGYILLEQGYRTVWLNGTCDDAGNSHPIYLNVSDGFSTDLNLWTLHCSNTAVTIDDPIVEEYWDELVPMAHQWNSTDPDYTQDNSWTLGGNPGFLSYEKGYRTVWVNGTCPDVEEGGTSYPIYLNVTDGATTVGNQWTLHCSNLGGEPENDPPVIDWAEDHYEVMVGNVFDQIFTATDPEGDPLWWWITTDNPYLTLWYDDDMAGVVGVPEIVGTFSVTIGVGETLRAENFDTFDFTLEVVTEDLTDCINCYVQGEIVLEDVFLNKYTYKLVTTSVTCRVQFYVWEFGDGTHKTTYGKTVEHWYWEPWFSTQWVNVSVQGYTDCGTARPLKEQMYVDNSWEIWICMLVLLVTSALLMRRAIQSQSRKNPALKRGRSPTVKGEAR